MSGSVPTYTFRYQQGLTTWHLRAIQSVSESLTLTSYLMSRLDSALDSDYHLILETLSSYIEDATSKDGDGVFYYRDLSPEEKQEFVASHLHSSLSISNFINALLDNSGLQHEVLTSLRERARIKVEDACECPICQPSSNGRYEEATSENMERYGCLLKDIDPRATRVFYYVHLLEGTDWLDAPYWLFQGYQVIKEVEWIAEGKRARERKVEEKRRETKRRQAALEEKRGLRPKPNTNQRVIRRKP